MRRISGIFIIIAVFIIGSLCLCHADTVVLKSGDELEGRVLRLDRAADQVVVEVPGRGIEVLKFGDVRSVRIGDEEPVPLPEVQPALPLLGGALSKLGKLVLEDDAGLYQWIDSTQEQTNVVHAGRTAFLATGNDYFQHRLGIVGDYTGQFRYLDLWIYLQNSSADIQVQVQVDGQWGKRWGFDAESSYNGYSWPMEGTTTRLRYGQWLHQRLDLIDQLHIHAGQAITGLSFASDNSDVYYDSVYLHPASRQPAPPTGINAGVEVLEDNAAKYTWRDSTLQQEEVVAFGRAAFKSNGNDHFEHFLGVVGDYPGQFRTISFWVFPIGPKADIQLQVPVDGVWAKRWGFDVEQAYNGYSWQMEGTSTGLQQGRWQKLSLDLIDDLHMNPGQRITGMAFSSANGNCYYDAVYMQHNTNPVQKPYYNPFGKQVLEDNAAIYSWRDAPETQNYLAFYGRSAFRATGNDYFEADLGGAVGDYRKISFWAFFMGSKADIQLQVMVNNQWGKRWGFDAEPVYNGYSWPMEGTTTNMPSGRWVLIEVDLFNQLHMQRGDRITGLAFSSDNSDVIYDSVYLR